MNSVYGCQCQQVTDLAVFPCFFGRTLDTLTPFLRGRSTCLLRCQTMMIIMLIDTVTTITVIVVVVIIIIIIIIIIITVNLL